MKYLYSCIVVVTMFLSGCSHQTFTDCPDGMHPDEYSVRLIIARADHSEAADNTAWLHHLAKQFGVKFDSLRTLSAGVYIVSMRGVQNEQQVNEILTALNQRKDIDYAQIDERFRIQ